MFGVATTAQLNRVEATIRDIAGAQTEVSHSYGQLATVINQTRSYMACLAVMQHQLEAHVINIGTAINALAQAMQNQASRIHRIEVMTDLNRYLDVLQLATRRYLDQEALFSLQRANLETGHLTRHLLSPSQLSDILQQANL